MRHFLGVEVTQNRQGFSITQQRYAKEACDNFGMGDSKLVSNLVVLGSKLTRSDEGNRVDSTVFK